MGVIFEHHFLVNFIDFIRLFSLVLQLPQEEQELQPLFDCFVVVGFFSKKGNKRCFNGCGSQRLIK